MLGLAIIGNAFIDIVFGQQYKGAYEVTMILMVGVFFMIYYKMIASYNIIIGKQIINFIFLGISVVGNIISNVLLIPRYGIYGAGAASVISYGLCSVLFLVKFRKMTYMPLKDMLFIKPTDISNLKHKLKKRNS